jgi:hypothetical protein
MKAPPRRVGRRGFRDTLGDGPEDPQRSWIRYQRRLNSRLLSAQSCLTLERDAGVSTQRKGPDVVPGPESRPLVTGASISLRDGNDPT